jgi:PTS system beta-glucosides-specific IIC component
MDYKKVAQDCMRLVGGKENVNTAAHCATRLRLQLVDKSKADIAGIKALDDVIDVKEVGIQTQIIIGPSVSEVYKQFSALMDGTPKTVEKVSYEKPKRGAIINKLMDLISGVFGPIIPAVTGAGMIKAIMAVAVLLGLSTTSQEYYILNFIADAGFYFLPVLLAYSCANKFGCNPYMAAMIALGMMHPNWSALVSAGEPVSFVGIPVTLVSYGNSVLPIFLMVWVMSYIEKFADKVSPNVVKAILKPMITIILTALLAFIVIGPIGTWVGNAIAGVVNTVQETVPMVTYTLVGATWPLLVFAGLHMAIFPPIQMAQAVQLGYETITGPSALAANTAVGAASIAAGLRCKNKKNREISISAGITALCGITEPALYGVVFKFKRPLIATMIGGACGGFFAGMTHLKRYAAGNPGLPTLGVFIGEEPMNIVYAVITVVIAVVVAFIVSFLLGVKEEEQ